MTNKICVVQWFTYDWTVTYKQWLHHTLTIIFTIFVNRIFYFILFFYKFLKKKKLYFYTILWLIISCLWFIGNKSFTYKVGPTNCQVNLKPKSWSVETCSSTNWSKWLSTFQACSWNAIFQHSIFCILEPSAVLNLICLVPRFNSTLIN